MKTVVDHLSRTVTYPFPPKKIVSLAPAITDTMYGLVLEEEIVGRTRFCIHPKDKVENALNIGGTKDIKLDRIHQLKPDLIIAEKEENTKEIVEELEQYYPVYVFEVQTVDDAFRMMADLGDITDRAKQANELIQNIKKVFKEIPHGQGKRIAYMIWQRPYMVVGKNTYIQSLLDKLGFVNPFTQFEGRYPEVTVDDLQRAQLDYLFLATEPFPFRDKHLNPMAELLPGVEPHIVDGEMFWYGVKMLEAVPYFKQTFNISPTNPS